MYMAVLPLVRQIFIPDSAAMVSKSGLTSSAEAFCSTFTFTARFFLTSVRTSSTIEGVTPFFPIRTSAVWCWISLATSSGVLLSFGLSGVPFFTIRFFSILFLIECSSRLPLCFCQLTYLHSLGGWPRVGFEMQCSRSHLLMLRFLEN